MPSFLLPGRDAPLLVFLSLSPLPFPFLMISQRVRSLEITAMAMFTGVFVAFIAQGLLLLINLTTNLSFYGRWSVLAATPRDNALGLWVCAVPVIGGLIVGFMARYGSKAIRGHGIPDVVQDAVEKMLEFDIGQLPVVSRDNPRQLLGILTRKGILTARKHQIDHENEVQPGWI
ncbi:MAG: CBS domain-containing protein [Candidatus Methylacidiphilales bacterium]|nr:CBS domain-containing protein [Candidatus Methylacidiphilales bacterium]